MKAEDLRTNLEQEIYTGIGDGSLDSEIVGAILSQIRQAVKELENPYKYDARNNPHPVNGNDIDSFESCRQSILKLLGGE